MQLLGIAPPVLRGELGAALVQSQSVPEEFDRFGTGSEGEYCWLAISTERAQIH
jgi:hypothetical protein